MVQEGEWGGEDVGREGGEDVVREGCDEITTQTLRRVKGQQLVSLHLLMLHHRLYT